MKYLLALLLTSLICGAQTQNKPHCLKLTKVSLAKHILHEKGKVSARLTFTGGSCSFPTAAAGNPSEGGAANEARLEMPAIPFEPESGIEARIVRTKYGKLLPAMDGLPATSRTMTVDLELKAQDKLRIGEHWNEARLTFPVVDATGSVYNETVPVYFSLKAAPAQKPGDFPDMPEGLKTTGLVILLIALSPVLLILGLICAGSSRCMD